MLGTQMVAKGLDFPKVTVVGVINADSSLHSSDFRSFERTFSLLTQVVGRSGRGTDSGTAVIQTNEPDSQIIELAAKQDYIGFYNSEILTRKLMIYPPYCEIATINFSGLERNITEDAGKNFLDILKTNLIFSAIYTIRLHKPSELFWHIYLRIHILIKNHQNPQSNQVLCHLQILDKNDKL